MLIPSLPPRNQRGFTLIEAMMVVLIVGMLGAIAIPAYQGTLSKVRRAAMVAEATDLHNAMTRYHVDQDSYPPEAGPSALNLSTLDPLASQGYFTQAGSFLSKLDRGRLLIYVAPNVGGTDREYLAIMRHAVDRSLVVLVADLSLGGAGYSGVYVLENGHWDLADGVN